MEIDEKDICHFQDGMTVAPDGYQVTAGSTPQDRAIWFAARRPRHLTGSAGSILRNSSEAKVRERLLGVGFDSDFIPRLRVVALHTQGTCGKGA